MWASISLFGCVAPQLSGEVLLQEQLDELYAFLVHFQNPAANVAVEGMHDLEFAADGFARVDLAFEVQDLTDFDWPGTHQHATTVAHVLQDAGKLVAAVAQGSFF